MAEYLVSVLKPQQISQTCNRKHITATAVCIAAKQLVQIIGNCTSVCRASYQIRFKSSSTIWEPQMSHILQWIFMRILVLCHAVQWCVTWINWSLTACK